MIDIGQTVGNYNITAKLCEGGMGTVFLAEHPVIGSKVALKAIHPYYARSPEIVARFVNEARAVKSGTITSSTSTTSAPARRGTSTSSWST